MPYLASDSWYSTITYNRVGRSGLKLPAISLGATFLAACGRALGIPVTPSPSLAPTTTSTSACRNITVTKNKRP